MIRCVIVATAVAGLCSGCQAGKRKAPYEDNPLIMTRQPLIKKPLQGKSGTDVAQADAPKSLAPPAPIPPSPQVQSPPPAPSWDIPGGPALPESAPVAPASLQPLPARISAEAGPSLGENSAAPPQPLATPVSAVRNVPGKYAHAVDHSWLQGELDRHYRGHLELRFKPPMDDDAFGGKVRLEDDPRLSEFRAGDVISVEGEMVRDGDRASGQYPRYRIRSVRLVERKP